MCSNANSADVGASHNPWNKGRLIGPKLPLKLRDIWAIRIPLQFGPACQRSFPFQSVHRQHASGLRSRQTPGTRCRAWRSGN